MAFRTTKSRGELRVMITSIKDYLTGKLDDEYGIAEVYFSAVANSFYKSAYDAFLIKSIGGTDDAGETWDDLTTRYKAYNRQDARDQLGLPYANDKRPSLEGGEDAIWRGIFGSTMSWLEKKYNLSFGSDAHKAARRRVGAHAWDELKKSGAKTIIGQMEGVKVPILVSFTTGKNSREGGALRDSYKPTDTSPYVPGENQRYERVGQRLYLGSSLEYADAVASRRAIWPVDMEHWSQRAMRAGRLALEAHLAEVMR